MFFGHLEPYQQAIQGFVFLSGFVCKSKMFIIEWASALVPPTLFLGFTPRVWMWLSLDIFRKNICAPDCVALRKSTWEGFEGGRRQLRNRKKELLPGKTTGRCSLLERLGNATRRYWTLQGGVGGF